MSISVIDICIVVLYMAGMLYMGFRLSKTNETEEDYFTASRKMPWLPVGLSIAATCLSATEFIGSPGWSYNVGMRPYVAICTIPLALCISLSVFVPIFFNLRVTSVYEYLDLRLGTRSRLLAVLAFLINSLIQAGSMIYIPALILQTFTGIDLNVTIIITVIVAIIYTLLGGIKAVIWTDAIQAVMMWVGLIGLMIVLFNYSGLGVFGTISAAHEAGKFNALDFSFVNALTDPNAVWVCLFGGFFIWLKYFCFDQVQVQRMLTAQSVEQLKKSFVVSSAFANGMQFLIVFMGPLLFVAYQGQEFATQNEIMINFIGELPVGLTGIILACLFAASMSSVDSLLNSMSAVFTNDIYKKFINKNPDAGLKTSMSISLIWGLLITVVTIMSYAGSTQAIVALVASYISYLSGPTCGLFLLAFFHEKANDRSVFYATAIGFVGTYIFGTTAGLTWKWNPLVGTIITLVAGLILVHVFAKDKQPARAKELTYQGYRAIIQKEHDQGDFSKVMPGKMDKYSYMLIAIFFIQFILLFILSI